jgi:hypothetical protein
MPMVPMQQLHEKRQRLLLLKIVLIAKKLIHFFTVCEAPFWVISLYRAAFHQKGYLLALKKGASQYFFHFQFLVFVLGLQF